MLHSVCTNVLTAARKRTSCREHIYLSYSGLVARSGISVDIARSIQLRCSRTQTPQSAEELGRERWRGVHIGRACALLSSVWPSRVGRTESSTAHRPGYFRFTVVLILLLPPPSNHLLHLLTLNLPVLLYIFTHHAFQVQG